MDKSPLVTIVTPSFNQGQFIEETILSVKNQTYQNIEHIIIDGKSSDSTISILKKYKNEYNMKWFSEKDNGPADAINKGFKKANGKLFAYLNSDDLLLPNAINKLTKKILKTNCDVAYGDGYLIDERNNIKRNIYSSSFLNLNNYIYRGSHVVQQSTLWTKDIYNKVGGFNLDNKTCWDAEFWIDILLKNGIFKKIHEPLSCFRHHNDSISCSEATNEQYEKDWERLFFRIMNRKMNSIDKLFLSNILKVIDKLLNIKSFIYSFENKKELTWLNDVNVNLEKNE